MGKRLKCIVLPPNFSISVVRLWITVQLDQLVGIHDDVLIGLVCAMLTDAHQSQTPVDPDQLEETLAPFMPPDDDVTHSGSPQISKVSHQFVKDLWEYLKDSSLFV